MNQNLRKLALGLIKFYQLLLSPIFGGNCRFVPTCSQYASQCFQEMTLWSAFVHTYRRLKKCHPLGASGYDPVPPQFEKVN